MRTNYDIEMMRQVGFCSGIENYSRHIEGATGSARTLLDYFPEDFLLVIDESHVTVPQIGGMYEGDISRKRTLSTTVSGCHRDGQPPAEVGGFPTGSARRCTSRLPRGPASYRPAGSSSSRSSAGRARRPQVVVKPTRPASG